MCPRIWVKLEGPETSVLRSGTNTQNCEMPNPRTSCTHEIKTNKRFEGATTVILLKLDLKLLFTLISNLRIELIP